MKHSHFYLIHIQYLGFRYHGYIKQPDVKTIELMIDKTLETVFGNTKYKTLTGSRTDSKVSANHAILELFVNTPLDSGKLLSDLNKNLPNDIRVLKIETVDKQFNIINSPRIKEYVYLFSYGEKCHPFCASLMSSFQYDLDIDLMKKGALIFQGTHNFIKYCTKPAPDTQTVREILFSKIEENTMYTANFFPERSYAYIIRSTGFLRYQVRLMMGQLVRLGKGEITLEEIKESLKGEDKKPLRNIAPSSGLILNKTLLEIQ